MRKRICTIVSAFCLSFAADAASSATAGLMEVTVDGLEMRFLGSGGAPTGDSYFPTGSVFINFDPNAPIIDFFGLPAFYSVARDANGIERINLAGFEGDFVSAGGRFVGADSGGVILTDDQFPFDDDVVTIANLDIIFGSIATSAIFNASVGDVLSIDGISIFEGGEDAFLDGGEFISNGSFVFAQNVNGVTATILQTAGSPAVIPLPATLPLMAATIAGLAMVRRRKSAQR